MKKIIALLLTVTLLLFGTCFAEASLELNAFPMVHILTEGITSELDPIVLEECEPFEIDGYEVLELVKITFNVDEAITAKFTFVTEFLGNEDAMICFETGGGYECWIFDDAVFEDNTVVLNFEEDLIAASKIDNTYLAIGKVIAVG